jgi:hypothetical protein
MLVVAWMKVYRQFNKRLHVPAAFFSLIAYQYHSSKSSPPALGMLAPDEIPLSSHADDGHELRNRVRSRLTTSETMYDGQMIDDTIRLAEEALVLSSEKEENKIDALVLLVKSLRVRLQDHMDNGLISRSIDLGREALALCGTEHPLRAKCCANLAVTLWTSFQRNGEEISLNEAINLGREALELRSAGHPDRSSSCRHLAAFLTTRYQRTGDERLLDEIIELQREALGLCPEGHPHRSSSCGYLASSLNTRYERTSDIRLLNEAINLERKALVLCPEGHPDRLAACVNLSVSLIRLYDHKVDGCLLEEATNLQRQALDLSPEGHPSRSVCCATLAGSLTILYEHTGDIHLSDEAISLEREALALRPQGHNNRFISCGNLAISLASRYERTGDVTLLPERLTLLHEALMIAPRHVAWRYSGDLAEMHLENNSPVYDVSKATYYIEQSLENGHDDTPMFLRLLSLLDRIWDSDLEDKHVRLTTIYQGFVNLLPLLAHPAIGVHPQLQALKICTRLGPDAFVNATLAGDCSSGLQNMELAHSVIWSQSLHRRSPRLDIVPEHLASRLQKILHAIAIGSAPEIPSGEAMGCSPQDALHTNSSQMYALLREIRALPGLDRFMLGETFETLRAAATDHPIVVLVDAHGHYYALIMESSLAHGYKLLELSLTDEDFQSASFKNVSTRSCRGGDDDVPSVVERLSLRKHTARKPDSMNQYLMALWYKVVKPVLDHLDLKASKISTSRV